MVVIKVQLLAGPPVTTWLASNCTFMTTWLCVPLPFDWQEGPDAASRTSTSHIDSTANSQVVMTARQQCTLGLVLHVGAIAYVVCLLRCD